MSLLFALDPGDKSTGWVVYDTIARRIDMRGDDKNEDMLVSIGKISGVTVVIETMTPHGKRVGQQVFDAIFWGARFYERALACGLPTHTVTRAKAKGHCLRMIGGNDSDIKTALVKAYGGKKIAVGTVKAPGPLFGATSHQLAALAVARTYAETQMDTPPHGHTNT